MKKSIKKIFAVRLLDEQRAILTARYAEERKKYIITEAGPLFTKKNQLPWEVRIAWNQKNSSFGAWFVQQAIHQAAKKTAADSGSQHPVLPTVPNCLHAAIVENKPLRRNKRRAGRPARPRYRRKY